LFICLFLVGLELELRVLCCKVGTLSLEPHFALVILEMRS
jgi:hypothetical protein